jgi:hypothetical protein
VLALEPERGTVLPAGARRLSFDFSYSNLITLGETNGESLVLDMESLRSTVRGRIGLGRGWELGAEAPVYVLHGGFLDGFVSGFHRALGIPNSVREREPEGLFRYRYARDAVPVVERSQRVIALGDIAVQMKKSISSAPEHELAMRAAVKLPLGSLGKGTGSGAADLGLGLAASRVGKRFGGYLNLTYHVLGGGGPLEARHYASVAASADLVLKERFALVLGGEHSRPFVESALPALTEGTTQLVLGVRFRGAGRATYEIRFTEDLSRASPDFTLGFALALDWRSSR